MKILVALTGLLVACSPKTAGPAAAKLPDWYPSDQEIAAKNYKAVTGIGGEEEGGEALYRLPMFPGGTDGLVKKIGETMQYPPLGRENNIQGKTVLTFVIGRDGVEQIQVVKSIGQVFDEEAIRVIQALEPWVPGITRSGKAAKVRYTLPLTFKLE